MAHNEPPHQDQHFLPSDPDLVEKQCRSGIGGS